MRFIVRNSLSVSTEPGLGGDQQLLAKLTHFLGYRRPTVAVHIQRRLKRGDAMTILILLAATAAIWVAVGKPP